MKPLPLWFLGLLPLVPTLAAEPPESPVAVPTFECIGLYWKAPAGKANLACETKYRVAGAPEWKQANPLWFDRRNQEYRGSIVGLRPGATYEISLGLGPADMRTSLEAKTWSEVFPVTKRIAGAAQSNKTLTVSESGSPDGFVLYEPAHTSGSAIDVASKADHCIVVRASNVILRGFTLKGARVHAILLEGPVHDVVIEECDISGWGRIAEDGWGRDYDAAVYSRDPAVKRIIVQRNRIHHPRSNSNNWQQARPGPGKRESSHPEGPQAVCLWDSEGNHVIRYNTVFSDEAHEYNDIFGAGHNFSTRGFPNRDSDIYGNLLSHCWDDAIESEGANCNVRIWGNYITEAYVGVACASTSIGPLYVWRNITGVIRESPNKISGAFFKTSDYMGGGKIYVFHNTILQPPSRFDPGRSSGAVVGLGWGGPMTNVMSRNNILHVTRQAIADRAHDPLGDYDYDLFAAPLAASAGQEKHGVRGVPVYVSDSGFKDGRGIFSLSPASPGFDAGVVLPNFNDKFSGSAPDIGAQEAGAAAMEFGVDAHRSGKPVGATQASEAEMLPNGAMEAAFANGLAQGWVPNCYGSNEVTFAEESTDVHGGKSAQRVSCTRFESGGVQFHSGDIAVEKGKPYTLCLWMKGDVKGSVYVGIRKHGAPYTPYLKRDVRVKNEWTPYLIIGQPSDSDPRCGVYLMFTGIGTLLVDDASLKPGFHEETVAEAAGPPQKGNRIYNSGFEAGPEGWTPVGGFALDDQVAHSGRFSARVEPGQVLGGPGGIECRPFPVRTGRRYTLSAWIKAAQPDTGVRLRLFEWADRGGDFPENRHERQTTIKATTQWARYQLNGIVLPNLHEGYVARLVPSGRIWVDDVQVEEGQQTDYKPAQGIEVGAETSTRWCHVGESVEVTARIAGASKSETFALRYTLEDLWSRPMTNLVHQVKADESDHARFLLNEPGMYRVRVQANDSAATGEVCFGVFPKGDRQVRPASPFGTHVTSTLPQPSQAVLASEAMGAQWVRLHDFGDFCHWYAVEPEKGRFIWHDAEIEQLLKCGFLPFANLGHPPRWAGRDNSKKSGGGWTPAPPRDKAEWENYVFRTVEHYHDRIHYWEVWNEPYWIGFFTGTPEEYAELLKLAYRAIKRADPNAIVVGGCFTASDEAWTKRVLAAGSLEFMDALSYHVYWSPPMTEPDSSGAAPLIAQQVQGFKELMRQAGQAKPIYMTEGGIRCPPFASWLLPDGFERAAPFGPDTGAGDPLTGLDAAAGLVRGIVEMLSAGVEKTFYYYSGHANGAMPWFSAMANGYYVLMDYDGRPKPTMMAYSALEFFIGDATRAGVVRRDGLTIHCFAPDKGAVAVIWSTRARTLAIPTGASVFNLMGAAMKSPALNPGEPVYVVAPGLTAAQLQGQL